MSSFKVEWKPLYTEGQKPDDAFRSLFDTLTDGKGGETFLPLEGFPSPRVQEIGEKGGRAEVDDILEEVKKKAEYIEREAFEKGFAQGERAGRETAEKGLESTIQAMEKAREALKGLHKEVAANLEEEVVRLALAVARKVLHREVLQDPKVVVDVVRAALKEGHLRDEVVIKVNPLDKDVLMQVRGDLIKELDDIKRLVIIADQSVGRGGAVVESKFGDVDARLERQMEEIEKGFNLLLREGKEHTG